MASLKHVKMSFSDPTNGFSRLHLGQCHSVAYIIPFWATGRSYHLLGRRDHSARTTTCWVRTRTMSFWWGTLSFLKRKETTTCLVCTSTMSFPDRGVQTMPSKSIKCEMGVFRHQVTAVWWNRFLWWLNKFFFALFNDYQRFCLLLWSHEHGMLQSELSMLWLQKCNFHWCGSLYYTLNCTGYCTYSDIVTWCTETFWQCAMWHCTLWHCVLWNCALCTLHCDIEHSNIVHCTWYSGKA